MNAEHVVLSTTAESAANAADLARAVVAERLAACAQITQIRSLYWWEGSVQDAPEWRVDFKTRADLAERLTRFVEARHGYDTPEVVVTPVLGGSAGYLAWVDQETTASQGQE
jgi:periplasmic divalent cation tolerance protein